MKEYTDRGKELENYCYLDYFVHTYDGAPCPPPKNPNESRGQKPSQRARYLEGCGRKTKCRIVRKDGHETKPEFIGQWFPRNDDADSHELYCAWILAFLTPWRSLRDICPENETFSERFRTFYASTDDDSKNIIKNIQYYWDCIDGAKKCSEESGNRHNQVIDIEPLMVEEEDIEPQEPQKPVHDFGEDDVESALAGEFSQDLRLYASVGMMIAEEVGIFKDKEAEVAMPVARRATREDAYQYVKWENTVRSISKRGKDHNIPDHSADLTPSKICANITEPCEPGDKMRSPLWTDLRNPTKLADSLRH